MNSLDFAVKSKELNFFVRSLQKQVSHFHRNDLPWRKNRTPYSTWVSEIMLQQTQVNRVFEYYQRFMHRFPDIQSLSQTSWEEFLPYYQGLGYYHRGKNMLNTAIKIVTHYHSKFPQDKKTLQSLSGIGRYTASAILAFGFGLPHLAFDTNMQKVFGRFLFGNKHHQLSPEQIELQLHKYLPLLNEMIMDFSNAICTSIPKCHICPVKKICNYHLTSGKNEQKKLSSFKKFPNKQAQVFLWLHNNHRQYYSAQPDSYEPFKLSSDYNTRQLMKEYFEKHYHLQLSVRPPRKKTYINGIPTLFVNAQILLGNHEFGVFSKQDALDYEEMLELNKAEDFNALLAWQKQAEPYLK